MNARRAVADLQLSLGQLHINHLQNVAEVLFEDIGSEQSGMSLLNEFKACSLIVGQVFRSLPQCIWGAYDPREYEKGKKISDETMAAIDLEPVGEFGKWNYKIRFFLPSSGT